MSGNRAGGILAAKKNKERNGEDFFKRIGKIGGTRIHIVDLKTGRQLRGFALNKERAKSAGAKGGATSRRGKK